MTHLTNVSTHVCCFAECPQLYSQFQKNPPDSLFHLKDTSLPLNRRLVCLAAELGDTKLEENVMSHKYSLSVLV